MSTVFRFIFWASNYKKTVEFYRDMLERPIIMDWDRGPTERGTIFKLGSGEVEVLALAPGKEGIQPKGFEIAIEVPKVDEYYRFVKEKGIPLRGEIADKPWGQRTFSVNDPDGIKLIFFTTL